MKKDKLIKNIANIIVYKYMLEKELGNQSIIEIHDEFIDIGYLYEDDLLINGTTKQFNIVKCRLIVLGNVILRFKLSIIISFLDDRIRLVKFYELLKEKKDFFEILDEDLIKLFDIKIENLEIIDEGYKIPKWVEERIEYLELTMLKKCNLKYLEEAISMMKYNKEYLDSITIKTLKKDEIL